MCRGARRRAVPGQVRDRLACRWFSKPSRRGSLPALSVKVCDLTQFYSPLSGGVKRYVAEKRRFVIAANGHLRHVLIVPGKEDSVEGDEISRMYTIASPQISKTSRYRVLFRLSQIERILERERPDLIESGDPYQVAWQAVKSGGELRIPVVGFYHSHFPEAYVRTVQKFLGPVVMEAFMDIARRYVRSLYGRFERTFVPSPALADLLVSWGLKRARVSHNDLGVDTEIFKPIEGERDCVRGAYGIPAERKLLLYVGRLAQEKNTHTLFSAFHLVNQKAPGKFQLFVVGDGLQRTELERLAKEVSGSVSHLAYCEGSEDLAKIYRAAELFVHPGVQETFGLATLEAQSCGTPVIGIRGSYMDRIIHNDQTMWAEANTPHALAEAILQMAGIAQRIDRVTLHRRIALKYSWDQIFDRLFGEYRLIIDSYRSRL